jgi:hypothetical protein
MSMPITPYESFSTSVPSGAWSLSPSDGCKAFPISILFLLTLALIGGVVSNSIRPLTSDPNHYDIECDVLSPFLQTVYYPTLEANISIYLPNYGGAILTAFALLCLLYHVALGHTGQPILEQMSLPGHLFQYTPK